MSSTAEAEIGGLYINAQKGVEEHNILEEMGHLQPPTPVQTDNLTKDSIVNLRVQKSAPKPWTCVFIGYAIGESTKNNSNFIGAQDH
jgi:hypothetical protein